MEDKILPKPSNLKVEEYGNELLIERKWFSAKMIVLLVFSLFWNSFLVVIYSIMAGSGNTPLFVYLFPLLHVAAGLFLFYTSIAGLINKTVLKADKMEISVKHTPLPWRGNKTISRYDVKQLFVRKTISRGRNSASVSFDVMLIQKDDSISKLLANLDNAEEGKFIEKKLEQFWNITDVKVEGEYDGQ